MNEKNLINKITQTQTPWVDIKAGRAAQSGDNAMHKIALMRKVTRRPINVHHWTTTFITVSCYTRLHNNQTAKATVVYSRLSSMLIRRYHLRHCLVSILIPWSDDDNFLIPRRLSLSRHRVFMGNTANEQRWSPVRPEIRWIRDQCSQRRLIGNWVIVLIIITLLIALHRKQEKSAISHVRVMKIGDREGAWNIIGKVKNDFKV